jgi:hypothetical protein
VKKILVFALGFALATFVFWLSGFDFDRRGETLASWFGVSVIAGLLPSLFVKARSKPQDIRAAFVFFLWGFPPAFLAALAFFWCRGVDLTHRSPELVVTLGGALVIAAFFSSIRLLFAL